MFPTMPSGRNFSETYRCYSVTMLGDRDDVERGGKSKDFNKLIYLLLNINIVFSLVGHLNVSFFM